MRRGLARCTFGGGLTALSVAVLIGLSGGAAPSAAIDLPQGASVPAPALPAPDVAPAVDSVTQAAPAVDVPAAEPVVESVQQVVAPVTKSAPTAPSARAPRVSTPVTAAGTGSVATHAPGAVVRVETPHGTAGSTSHDGGVASSAGEESRTEEERLAERERERTPAERRERSRKVRETVRIHSACLDDLDRLRQRRVLRLRAALDEPKPRTREAVAGLLELGLGKVIRAELRGAKALERAAEAGCGTITHGGGSGADGQLDPRWTPGVASRRFTAATSAPDGTQLADADALEVAGERASGGRSPDGGRSGASTGRRFDSDGGEIEPDDRGVEEALRRVAPPGAQGATGLTDTLGILLLAAALTGIAFIVAGFRRDPLD